MKEITNYVAVDFETNGLDPRWHPDFKTLGVAYAKLSGEADYLSFGHIGNNKSSIEEAQETIASFPQQVYHNCKFERVVFKRLGWYQTEDYYDTLLMQHFIDENLPNKSLDFLGKYHFNETKVRDERMKTIIDGPGWGFIPAWLISPYAIQDAKLTLKLFYKLYPTFVSEGFDD